MSHDEDQMNEMEAMEAIYGSDYQLESTGTPRAYTLTIVPNTDGADNHVSCRLHVTYPAGYPTVSAELIVRPIKGLNNEQMSQLSSIAQSTAAANTGEVCVFQISETLKDWLINNNRPSMSMFEQMEARKKEESDRADALTAAAQSLSMSTSDVGTKRAVGPSPLGIEPGTIVTVESFMRWKAMFDDEQRKLREEREKELALREQRLTGKQLFLQNLAKELGDDEADALMEEPEEKKVFYFNAGLYADDDADLPDDEESNGDADEAEAKENEDDAEEEAKPQKTPPTSQPKPATATKPVTQPPSKSAPSPTNAVAKSTVKPSPQAAKSKGKK